MAMEGGANLRMSAGIEATRRDSASRNKRRPALLDNMSSPGCRREMVAPVTARERRREGGRGGGRGLERS
jgi:hypothetical protein